MRKSWLRPKEVFSPQEEAAYPRRTRSSWSGSTPTEETAPVHLLLKERNAVTKEHMEYRGGPCQRDRILHRISTLFLGPTQRLFFLSKGPTSLRTFPTHWFPRLKQLLCVRESESRMYVAQLWPSACPKKENRSARFAKAATSSYLVDVSPTHSFARCVGLVGADLDLGGRVCV